MMNENPEPIKESTEQEENKIAINYKPKEKNPRRVAAGKKGAEARARNAELRKKEQEKLKKENLKLKMTSEQSEKNELPQITKDSSKDFDKETDETDHEVNVKKHSRDCCPSKPFSLNYKLLFLSIGIAGLGFYVYQRNKCLHFVQIEKTPSKQNEQKRAKKERN